jgi:ubiquinone/menaquinone biosynthesis C-methylase UbiE
MGKAYQGMKIGVRKRDECKNMADEKNRVCPVEYAGALDSRIRRWLQDPQKILAPYVHEGMTVLDVGCGPGFFSIELAKMVGRRGKVIAVDLQEAMLEKFRNKIRGTELEERIKLVKCDKDRLNVSERIDFGLVFFMVHEVPDKERFFKELKSILRDTGQILLVEPRLFHVSKKDFAVTTKIAENAGFIIEQAPRLLLSHSAMLKHAMR